MQKITPFLWFDTQAEEAMNFYTSIFKNAKVGKIFRYGKAGPGPEGSVLTASFELEGLEFTALNGGPRFNFTEAISLHVACESQEEVDYFWSKFSEGGQIQQCQGQVWPLLANHPDRFAQAARRPRSRKGKTRYAGDDADEKDRHSHVRAGVCGIGRSTKSRSHQLNRP